MFKHAGGGASALSIQAFSDSVAAPTRMWLHGSQTRGSGGLNRGQEELPAAGQEHGGTK